MVRHRPEPSRRSAAGHPFFWLFVAAIAPALLRCWPAAKVRSSTSSGWPAWLDRSCAPRSGRDGRCRFPWNVLIGGWTLALSLSWPVLVAREIGFRLTGFFDTGAVNSWSLMSAPYAASWTLYVVLAQLIGALWFEWAREKAALLRSPIRAERPLGGRDGGERRRRRAGNDQVSIC